MKPCLDHLRPALRFFTPCTFCTITRMSSSSPGSAESQHVRIGHYFRQPRLHISFVSWCFSTSVRPMIQLAEYVIPLATQTVTAPDTVSTWLVTILMIASTASLGRHKLSFRAWAVFGLLPAPHLKLPASPQSRRLTHATWR